MFYYLLTVFLIFGIVHGQAQESCPPVSSLQCLCRNPNRCNTQGFVRLGDGTICLGCPVRLRRTRANMRRIRNRRCPYYRCHMLEYRPECKLLEQFALVGRNLCPVCSVLYCPRKMPTVSITKLQ